MARSMTLSWQKCQGEVWCKLNAVDVEHSHFANMNGVYIIWHGGTAPAVVYVGKGNVRDRIRSHRTKKDIQQYAPRNLFVTWAQVDNASQAGVEAYLDSYWKPLVGERHPAAEPIVVNSPWKT